MPEMPTLGPQPKRSPMGTVVLIAVVAGLSGGGVYWWSHRGAKHESAKPSEQPNANALGNANDSAAANAVKDAGAQQLAVAPVAANPLAKSGLKTAHVQITGPLETAVVDAVGRDVGPALTQVLTRSLVWWVEVPGDLKKSDVIDVLYEEVPNEEPVVHAIRFQSEKLGKTVAAYRYKAASDSFPRFYQADGAELELRLKNAPLDDYEQVTSLLRDGRRHKGVDFKTPVGTPVKATFSGTITRKNWNFRGNGNSIEISFGGGRKALYLHLSELPKSLQVGQHVSVGQVLAQSGNTGHSFAPHLHYQLMLGEAKVLDPFSVHDTWRRSIASADLPALKAEVLRLDGLLAPPVATNTP